MAVVDPTTVDGLVGDPAAAAATGYTGVSGNTLVGISGVQNAQMQADYVGGTNIAQTATDIVNDPSSYLQKNDMNLSDKVVEIDANTAGTTIDNNKYSMDTDALQTASAQAGVATAAGVTAPTSAQNYQAETTYDLISDQANQMNAATMAANSAATINAEQIDIKGTATGRNADGSINYTGEALSAFANQDISNVIDTSTVSGKLLAQSLGEGNYVDAKATVIGQLESLQDSFTDPVTGQPKIPTWAAGVARNVSRIMALKGVTGTAAMATMSQAIMEATLPIAQSEAAFFQNVTFKNLDNKQQQTINTANVLSKMDVTNLDSRMTAAVETAKNLMSYDMKNLDNQQQTNVINTQARIQSILEDAKQVNASRQFNASEQNTLDRFYDQLGAQIEMFNADQRNTLEKFNTGEMNDTLQFNATLENNREQFYQEMQYQIDQANAKWRQDVTLQNNENLFNAAAMDVKNALNISTEMLNQMWDRSDSLLDYAWKEGENAKDREVKIEIAKMELEAAQAAANAKKSSGFAGAMGSVLGAVAGQAAGSAFGAGGVLALTS